MTVLVGRSLASRLDATAAGTSIATHRTSLKSFIIQEPLV